MNELAHQNPNPTTVFVAEDHELLRDGLRFLFAKSPDWQMVGESADGLSAISEIHRLKPEIVILDLKLFGVSGETVLQEVRKAKGEAKFVVLTQSEEPWVLRRILAQDIEGLIVKTGKTSQVLDALEAVKRGDKYISPEATEILETTEERPVPPLDLLTEREKQVARLTSQGKTNKAIAMLLGCSDETVKSHKANLMRKLGFSSSTEISAWAVKVGLI